MTPAKFTPNWIDRAVGYVSPRHGLNRIRARVAADLLKRHYEGAAVGRRTQGWRGTGTDANAAVGSSLQRLRDNARDLVRNNPHAANAIDVITNQVVGWGILAKTKDRQAAEIWKQWAESTACDADGQHNIYGLQKLVVRAMVESGEVLVRRRYRLPTDGLPIPMQLQLLEPDYIDTSRSGILLPNGGRIIHGVEFDAIGTRVAYWLFRDHPGSTLTTFGAVTAQSVRVDAANVLHVYHKERIGQVRGPSWFAPVLLKLKDFDEYDDAQLMKQKIAACLSVLVTDVDGSAAGLGTVDTTTDPQIDTLEPGMIQNLPPGRDVKVVDPPQVDGFAEYSEVTLRTIAAGIGVTYEDLTGDYTDLPFSAARMSRLAHQARVDDWRWKTLIPQFCDQTWQWAMEAAAILGKVRDPLTAAAWTPPPVPYIDPEKEGIAFIRNIRGGAQSWSESVRERGYDPDELLAEIAADNQKFDAREIILDSDPRNTTQQGGPRTASTPPMPEPPKTGAPPNGSEA
jgi:lambda family phage portal protein